MPRPSLNLTHLAIVVAFLAPLAFVVIGCDAAWELLRENRQPNRYILPDGYVGWVRIDYEVAGAPGLDTEDGYRLFSIPGTGYLQTASSFQEGWATDEYYYEDYRGSRKPLGSEMIWHHVGLGTVQRASGPPLLYEQFFVGTEGQAERSWDPELHQPLGESLTEPIYGPVPTTGS